MNKKIIATVLSTLFLFNSAHASGTTKSDTHTLIKYFLLGAGAGVVAILPPTAILISGALKGSNSTNTTTKTESECNIKSWKDVADLYFKAAEAEKNSKGETAEHYEHLADGYRCLYNFDRKNETWPTQNDEKAADNFEKASTKYAERAKQFESDKTSYSYQINSAKAAEMNAKYNEYVILCAMCFDPETGRIYSADNKPKRCAKAWEALKGKKLSYDAYAEAKRFEHTCAGTPKVVVEAWGKVKNDKALQESFSHSSWEAYKAFAEANRREWLFKCGESDNNAVHEAWFDAFEKDKICAQKYNSILYKAFSAEAYQKAQDALTMIR